MSEERLRTTDRVYRPQSTIAWAPKTGLYLPELRVVVGHDGFGGAMAAHCYISGEGVLATRVALVEKRWREGPQTLEECVQVALSGLAWYQRQLGDVSE